MPSMLTRMIQGELPARVVWQDDVCVAVHSNTPIRPGHCLLFPRLEVTNWLDLSSELASHLILCAQKVGRGIQKAFQPVRVSVGIVSIMEPHVHIHLVPVDSVPEFDFSKQNRNATAAELDAAAERVRAALRELGY